MLVMTHSYMWRELFMSHRDLPIDAFSVVDWDLRKFCSSGCVWHDSFIRVTWLMHMCDLTHSYVWHESFICMTRPNDWDLREFCSSGCVWHDSFIRVTWLIHMCDMTQSYLWHDLFMRSAALDVCGMPHSHVWRDSFICVTWLSHMCDMNLHTCDMTQRLGLV